MHILTSLHQKMIFGYTIIGLTIFASSLFTLLELHWMEHKILAGEQIGEFYDTVLELRRFEKNFFLYHQQEDFQQHKKYLSLAQHLLQTNQDNFVVLVTFSQFLHLDEKLREYQQLLTHYAQGQNTLAQQIRMVGKELLKAAQDIAQIERQQLQNSLKRHRHFVLMFVSGLFLLLIGMGQLLYRMVAKPLKGIEAQMEAIAQGEVNRLEIISHDREIISLSQTFNHVLHELELRQKHLFRSEKLASLGTLLSGVAHELNNPLSNISTSCQILLEELDTVEKEFQQELLIQIDEQTHRMRNIVRSLLDFARDRQFLKEVLPLAVLIQETLRFLRGQMATQVTISMDISEEIVVYGDKQRLQQLFLNLLKNAVEAVEGEGEVKVTITSHLSVSPFPSTCPIPENEGVNIEICDNGLGISPEMLPKIFDPFFTTKDVGKGFGLGLAIVYEIIEEHGGSITAESTLGEGSCFYLRLPKGRTH